jgi:hypothetical protein
MKTATLVIAALLIGGGVYLYSEHQKAAQSSPSLEAKVNSALLTETNPFVLTALAQECTKAGRQDLADELNAKAKLLFATTHVASAPGPTGDTHPATAVLNVAALAPAVNAPQLSLVQATLGAATQGSSLDPNTGDSVYTGPGVHAPRHV